MKTPQEIIADYVEEGARLRVSFLGEQAELLDRIGFTLAKSLAAGGKVLICGNGGSAADAQHMSAELVGRYNLERPALPAIALSVDTSILTSVGNDQGFDDIFARQVRALGRPDDVLVALSTSGNSPNVLSALRAAREIGLITVGLTGKGGGLMGPLCTLILDVPSQRTPLVQEIHEASIHILCHLVDYYLFENAAALQTADPQGV